MVRKWMLKYLAQKGLSQLPFGAGWHVNAWLQRRVGGLKDAPIYGLRTALTMVWLLEQFNYPVQGQRIVELGTGWDGSAALTLLALGAARVESFDSRRHLDPKLKSKALRLLAERRDYRETDELPFAPDYERLIDQCRAEAAETGTFVYHAPADAQATGLPADSVDLYYSLAVLEHVPVAELQGILAESFRILRPGGFCYHYVQPRMHAADMDSFATDVEFLGLSDFWWNALFANPISYENRLRACDYEALLKSAGFRILQSWRTVDTKSLQALPRLKLDAKFAGFSPEELATSYFWVIAQKPA